MSPATEEDFVLIFLPGLEGGVDGSKARYFRACFPRQTHCIDFHMSLLNPFKANGFLRSGCSLHASLRSCVKTARIKIEELFLSLGGEKKFVLVGSSWGGLVALELLKQLADEAEGKVESQQDKDPRPPLVPFPDRVLLFAPALRCLRHEYPNWTYLLDAVGCPHVEDVRGKYGKTIVECAGCRGTTTCWILHGDADTVVDISGSRALVDSGAPNAADHAADVDGLLGGNDRDSESECAAAEGRVVGGRRREPRTAATRLIRLFEVLGGDHRMNTQLRTHEHLASLLRAENSVDDVVEAEAPPTSTCAFLSGALLYRSHVTPKMDGPLPLREYCSTDCYESKPTRADKDKLPPWNSVAEIVQSLLAAG
eukprot:g17456.t1